MDKLSASYYDEVGILEVDGARSGTGAKEALPVSSCSIVISANAVKSYGSVAAKVNEARGEGRNIVSVVGNAVYLHSAAVNGSADTCNVEYASAPFGPALRNGGKVCSGLGRIYVKGNVCAYVEHSHFFFIVYTVTGKVDIYFLCLGFGENFDLSVFAHTKIDIVTYRNGNAIGNVILKQSDEVTRGKVFGYFSVSIGHSKQRRFFRGEGEHGYSR